MSKRDIANFTGWLERVYTLQNQQVNQIILDKQKNDFLNQLRHDAKVFYVSLSKLKIKSTEYSPMSHWVNGDDEVIYKNWEEMIVTSNASTFDALATLIIPYISYRVLYETGSDNDIDFYDGEYNLKQTTAFEIRDNTLYLKVSVYLKKYFESESLIVPNAKLLIHFKNPLEVLK